MNRRSIIKRLAFAPLMAAVAVDLAFKQPEINGTDVMQYVPKKEMGKLGIFIDGKKIADADPIRLLQQDFANEYSEAFHKELIKQL